MAAKVRGDVADPQGSSARPGGAGRGDRLDVRLEAGPPAAVALGDHLGIGFGAEGGEQEIVVRGRIERAQAQRLFEGSQRGCRLASRAERAAEVVVGLDERRIQLQRSLMEAAGGQSFTQRRQDEAGQVPGIGRARLIGQQRSTGGQRPGELTAQIELVSVGEPGPGPGLHRATRLAEAVGISAPTAAITRSCCWGVSATEQGRLSPRENSRSATAPPSRGASR